MQSLNAIASQIKNDVLHGLAGAANFPISLEQIKDTVTSMRARLAQEVASNPRTRLKLEGLWQIIPDIPLKQDTEFPERYTFRIPILIALTGVNPAKYIGQPNFRKPYRLLTEHRYSNGADIHVGDAPAVFVDVNGEGEIVKKDCNLKKELMAQCIFSDPREVRNFGCNYNDDMDYPMPQWMVDQVTGKLTNDYLRSYRPANPQPNTGTMIMNPAAAAE